MSNETKISPESQKVLEQQAAEAKLKELEGISRLVVNTLNLICSKDITIPSAYAKPVGEIQDWLSGMHQNLQQNISMIKSVLPAEKVKDVPEAKEDVKQPVVDQGSGKEVALEVRS